jgi:hypothetical protein
MGLNGSHEGLHRDGQGRLAQVVKTTWKQVGVDGGQLEAGVAKINRSIKGGAMVAPLGSEPVLNVGAVIQNASLQVPQATTEAGL